MAAQDKAVGGGGLYTDTTLVQTNLGDNPAHIATAIRAAKESVVLLANVKVCCPLWLARNVPAAAICLQSGFLLWWLGPVRLLCSLAFKKNKCLIALLTRAEHASAGPEEDQEAAAAGTER